MNRYRTPASNGVMYVILAFLLALLIWVAYQVVIG